MKVCAMFGLVGALIRAADYGNPQARKEVDSVFCERFRKAQGWLDYLEESIPGGSVERMLDGPDPLSRQQLQALFVACWIYHPTEKGAYMVKLSPAQGSKVRGSNTDSTQPAPAANAPSDLQTRRSSHLSVAGAGPTGYSAHKGWSFLMGYSELLVQNEGDPQKPYLFLKCEGAPMSGLANTVEHGVDWAYKSFTGHGKCYSPALHNLAKDHPGLIDLRAAENFSKAFERLIQQLGLKGGTLVTVSQVVNAIYHLCHGQPLAEQILSDTRALAARMLGPRGLLVDFKLNKELLRRKGVTYDEKAEKELNMLADYMSKCPESHPNQHYREVRVSPHHLTDSLRVFAEHCKT